MTGTALNGSSAEMFAPNPTGAPVASPCPAPSPASDRPAYDEKRDVFLRYHEVEFDRAFEFDRAMLENLGVVEARIEWVGWDSPKVLSGSRLR